MPRTLATLFATALVLTMLAGTGEAQRRLLLRDLKLSAGDVEMLAEASNRAYGAGAPSAWAKWANDASGNDGAARVIRRFEHEGMACRRIEHRIRLKDRADPIQLVLDTCLDADGVWKLI